MQQRLHAELGNIGARDAALRCGQQLIVHAQHQLPLALPTDTNPRNAGYNELLALPRNNHLN